MRAIRWNSLHEAMIARGVTDEALALHMEVSRKTVGDWRRGDRQPNVAGLRKIAAFLQIDPGVLMADIPEKHLPHIPQNAE